MADKNIAKMQQMVECLYNPREELKTSQFFFTGSKQFDLGGGT
jgi:hypothetical protein